MSDIAITAVTEADRTDWDGIVTASRDAWLGHAWEWNALVEDGVWRTVRLSLIVRRAGHAIGIVPLHMTERRIGPLSRRVLHSNYWANGGLALRDDLSSQDRSGVASRVLDAIHALARARMVDKLVLRVPPVVSPGIDGHEEPGLLRGEGAVDETSSAALIDLRSAGPDELWDRMQGRARTAIRKAQRQGLEIRLAEQSEGPDLYYPLHLATYRRTGARPLPYRYFDTILRTPWSRLFVAYHEGRPVAAVNIGLFQRRAVYWTNASLDVARDLEANSLLQWEAIQWLAAGRTEVYELGDVGSASSGPAKLRGLAQYKASFGGRAVPYGRASYVYRPARERLLAFARRIAAP